MVIPLDYKTQEGKAYLPTRHVNHVPKLIRNGSFCPKKAGPKLQSKCTYSPPLCFTYLFVHLRQGLTMERKLAKIHAPLPKASQVVVLQVYIQPQARVTYETLTLKGTKLGLEVQLSGRKCAQHACIPRFSPSTRPQQMQRRVSKSDSVPFTALT